MPLLQPVRKAWTDALLNSPFRGDFEKKYGSVFKIGYAPAELNITLSWKAR